MIIYHLLNIHMADEEEMYILIIKHEHRKWYSLSLCQKYVTSLS